MSSWLARSITNSLVLENNEYEGVDDDDPTNNSKLLENQTTLRDGVKGDLSEFTESLTRQIWGVASFLAPPPPPPLCQPGNDGGDVSISASGDGGNEGVVDVSILGSGGGSNMSNSIGDGGKEGVVGVTEEVLGFAMNIAHHPETWLDFPLSEDEDSDDFEMSDTQWNHATLVERLVPRLAALRIEFCPIHMSESYFWKVYFVLLHPRLNKHDADLLSTPQIVAARTTWMKELQVDTKPGPESFEGNTSRDFDSHEDFNTTSSDSPPANMSEKKSHAFEPTTYHTVTDKEPVLTKEEESANVTSDHRAVPSYLTPIEDFGDDEDNWIHENAELDGYEGPYVPLGTDEDISFSDLEDDDCTMPTRSNPI